MVQKQWIVPFLSLIVLLSIGTCTALADDLSAKVKKIEELMAIGEAAAFQQAAPIVEELLAKYPNTYEVLWKAAKFYEKSARFTAAPLKAYEKGKALAEKAVSLFPDRVEGHYWLASLMGRVGEEKGILNSLFMVKPMKAELDRCLEIDPKFPDTYYVLGLLYWKVPGWPVSIGDKKLAVQYAAQAVQLRPESFVFRWGLYEAYQAAGKRQEAESTLQQIIKQPAAAGYEKEAVEYKAKAREKLK